MPCQPVELSKKVHPRRVTNDWSEPLAMALASHEMRVLFHSSLQAADRQFSAEREFQKPQAYCFVCCCRRHFGLPVSDEFCFSAERISAKHALYPGHRMPTSCKLLSEKITRPAKLIMRTTSQLTTLSNTDWLCSELPGINL